MSLEDWESGGELQITSSSDPKVNRLLKAIANAQSLSIRYSKPGGVDNRSIKPLRVFKKRGESEPYLDAFCLKRNAKRTFMIRRITFLDDPSSGPNNSVADRTRSGSVLCSVAYVDLEGDNGPQAGVEVTCNRCKHTAESFGEGSESIRRCLALLREDCPRNEKNWYVEE
jgi:hypothetical protein